MDAVDAALAALGDARGSVTSLELAENLDGDQRAVHLDVTPEAPSIESSLARAVEAGRFTGCTARGQLGPTVSIGEPVVCDPLSVLTRGLAATGSLARHPAAFFQGNRFLLPDLVGAVLEATPPAHAVLDLYAGVGLFTVALAGTGRDRITAIEGDKTSAADLRDNAAAYPSAIHAVVGRVEDCVHRTRTRANTIIVDPPRTGMSRDAVDAITAHRAERIVYVSCDPPTMARDARRLLDGGYRLISLKGFDLFPNTPHVETMGVFERVGGEEGATGAKSAKGARSDRGAGSAQRARAKSASRARGVHPWHPTHSWHPWHPVSDLSPFQPLPRCGDKRIEQRLEFPGSPEVFRVPLHPDTERGVGCFDALRSRHRRRWLRPRDPCPVSPPTDGGGC